MFLFTLFVVVVGSVYSIKEQIRIRELRQYVQWKPRPVIKDYEFIHNGEALVIEWDDADERELIKEATKDEPQFAYQLNTPNGASVERYIMQESYKLKASSDKFSRYRTAPGSAPYLSYNEPKEGEYWLIDVYDTNDRKLKPMMSLKWCVTIIRNISHSIFQEKYMKQRIMKPTFLLLC